MILAAFSLAWQPDAMPAGDARSGTLTIGNITAFPVHVEWGDGQTETIHAPTE